MYTANLFFIYTYINYHQEIKKKIMEHRAFIPQDSAKNNSNLQACVMVQMVPSPLERQLCNYMPMRASAHRSVVTSRKK